MSNSMKPLPGSLPGSSSGSSANNPSLPLSEKLLKLMKSENRPFAFNDIHDRIGKQYSKQVLQNCVEQHVAANRFIEKANGKLKVYCFNNKLSKVNIETQRSELKALDDKLKKYTKSIGEKQERIKSIESQLKKDSVEVPLPILQAQHDTLTESVNNLQSRADELKQSIGPKLDPKEYAKLQLKRDANLLEFRNRKRLCMNLVDSIMEGYPKTKQKLIEDSEIETDEAAGFDINQYK